MKTKYRLKKTVTDEMLSSLGIFGTTTIRDIRRHRFGITERRHGFHSVFDKPVPTIMTAHPKVDGWCLPMRYIQRVQPAKRKTTKP